MSEGEIKYKITHDFILDLYEEAKLKEGKEFDDAMEVVKFLSTKIGDYLMKENIKERPKKSDDK